jgi:hypothetical protein
MAPTDSRDGNTVPIRAGAASVDATLALELLRRELLAVQWCEAVAHNGDGVARLNELVAAEDRIAQLWPTYWRRNAHRVLMRDVPLIHSEDRPIPECPTCLATGRAQPADAA